MKTNSKKQRRDTFKNHGARSVHIFDVVFRTMCEKMPKLLIPLINEAFGTSYTEKDKFEQLRNERHLEDKRIITDALVKICGHIYHIECQSTDSDHMILRMFEYDTSIAIEHWIETSDGFEVTFPRSCVVYLRGEKTAYRNKKLRVKFPDGKSHNYTVKVIELRKYSKDELFKKKLLMFLPYYILKYEDNLPFKRDKVRFQSLIKEYEDIIGFIENALPYDQDGYRRKLYEKEVAESQVVLALLQDRVLLVKSLADTHERTVRQNKNVSYHDQLEALQETVRRYHDYLELLRHDQSFMQDLESALNAGKGNVMTKARHLLEASISEEDYQVLALYLTGMKPSSISFVTGISQGTLRTKKSRIKSRLEKCTPSRERDFILRQLIQN